MSVDQIIVTVQMKIWNYFSQNTAIIVPCKLAALLLFSFVSDLNCLQSLNMSTHLCYKNNFVVKLLKKYAKQRVVILTVFMRTFSFNLPLYFAAAE